MSSNRFPQMGDTVGYHIGEPPADSDPTKTDAIRVHPALVTRVHDVSMVNLLVFVDGSPTPLVVKDAVEREDLSGLVTHGGTPPADGSPGWYWRAG